MVTLSFVDIVVCITKFNDTSISSLVLSRWQLVQYCDIEIRIGFYWEIYVYSWFGTAKKKFYIPGTLKIYMFCWLSFSYYSYFLPKWSILLFLFSVILLWGYTYGLYYRNVWCHWDMSRFQPTYIIKHCLLLWYTSH